MTVIHPRTAVEASSYAGEFRAGGTDVEARRRIGLTHPVTVDLRRVEGLGGIDRTVGGTRIGAMTRVAAVVRELMADYPALALTAGSLANPHTRAVATVGGNLLQQTRCWYYRTGDVDCLKTGGEGCPARSGIHHFGNVFDTSTCLAPHPSSLAAAFLVYDATVVIHPDRERPVDQLFDPVDPRHEHRLEAGQVLVEVRLPAPTPGERGAYVRATGRELAEWPIVEAVVRMTVDDSTITAAWVAVGGVAPVPMRLRAVEEALVGAEPTDDVMARAAANATDGARPAPQASYKLDLMVGTVQEALERAAAGGAVGEAAPHERPL